MKPFTQLVSDFFGQERRIIDSCKMKQCGDFATGTFINSIRECGLWGLMQGQAWCGSVNDLKQRLLRITFGSLLEYMDFDHERGESCHIECFRRQYLEAVEGL